MTKRLALELSGFQGFKRWYGTREELRKVYQREAGKAYQAYSGGRMRPTYYAYWEITDPALYNSTIERGMTPWGKQNVPQSIQDEWLEPDTSDLGHYTPCGEVVV